MEKKILSLFFCLAIILWLVFVIISGYTQHPLGLYTQIPLIIIPIYGGIIGLKRFNSWGGFKTVMGKSLFFLSTSLIVWGVALGMWTYFIIAGTVLPYPSAADYVFIWSPVLWTFGLVFLAKVTGAPFALKNVKEIVVGIITTLFVAMAAYYVLVIIGHNNILSLSESGSLQAFFDYAYTFETLAVIIISSSIFVFSYKYLGGRYKIPVLYLLLGYTFHFVAIFFFVKTIGDETYFNGNIADLLFTIALYLEGLGVIRLDPKLISNNNQ